MTHCTKKRHRLKKHILTLATLAMCGISVSSISAKAQQLELGKIQGMRHMSITPGQNENSDNPRTKNEEKQNVPQQDTAHKTAPKYIQEQAAGQKESYRPLEMEETLVPSDDLQTWSDMSLAASAHTQKELAQLQYNIEQNRGVVPPQGLFLAAQSFAQAGQMQQAGLYYILGQLRLEFDRARWPMHRTQGDIEREKANARKTEDQALPNSSEARMYNPHRHIEALDSTVGPPIFSWLVKDPTRLKQTLAMAETWDAASPYAYDPGYDVGTEKPFEDWPKLLNHTRTEYFTRMRSLQQTLSKYVDK